MQARTDTRLDARFCETCARKSENWRVVTRELRGKYAQWCSLLREKYLACCEKSRLTWHPWVKLTVVGPDSSTKRCHSMRFDLLSWYISFGFLNAHGFQIGLPGLIWVNKFMKMILLNFHLVHCTRRLLHSFINLYQSWPTKLVLLAGFSHGWNRNLDRNGCRKKS